MSLVPVVVLCRLRSFSLSTSFSFFPPLVAVVVDVAFVLLSPSASFWDGPALVSRSRRPRFRLLPYRYRPRRGLAPVVLQRERNAIGSRVGRLLRGRHKQVFVSVLLVVMVVGLLRVVIVDVEGERKVFLLLLDLALDDCDRGRLRDGVVVVVGIALLLLDGDQRGRLEVEPERHPRVHRVRVLDLVYLGVVSLALVCVCVWFRSIGHTWIWDVGNGGTYSVQPQRGHDLDVLVPLG